jgi:electron transfer flavoprotein alpha subunit
MRETVDIKEEQVGVKILEVIDGGQGAGTVDITAADVIICGGRGVGSKEGFQALQELAEVMGGQVACSRAAVEDELAPMTIWVGQSGVTVRPKIYIACGVSGAIQHLAGMRDSAVIIAINYDRQAPIFQVATYGIEGDCTQVVPAMTSYIKEKRAGK